jgi:RNA polymerase sigma-70 factor (ECF subfamily)
VPPATRLEADLTEQIAAARGAWPGLALGEREFRAELERRGVLDGEQPTTLRLKELYLACACATGDAAALAAFEACYAPQIISALSSMRLSSVEQDEAQQLVRHRLFIAAPGARPKIAEYSGRGALGGWLRVLTKRVVLNQRRDGGREQPVDGDLFAALPSAADDPELVLLKKRYRAAFREAVTEALAALSPRERLLLRHHHVDRLGVGEIAAAHGVHRVTAGRWLDDARQRFVAAARQALGARIPSTGGNLRSALHLVESRLDLSLGRLLDGGT